MTVNAEEREGTGPGWHAFFGLTLGVAVVLALAAAGWPRAALVIVGAVVIVAGYVVNAREDGRAAYHDLLLIGSSLLGCAVVAVVTPAAALLLPALVPQLFWFLPLPRALASVTALFALCVGALLLHQGASGQPALVALVVGFVFSLIAGTWVSQIVSLSESRAQALRHLAATQADLAEASRQQGAAAERARMAQDVHDGVLQRLTVTRMLLEVAHQRQAGSGAVADDTHTAMAYEQVVSALGELRGLLARTAEDDLEEDDFERSVTMAVQAVTTATGLRSQVTVDLEGCCPSPVARGVILRVLREALSNTAAHARAGRVEVSVRPDGEMLLLEVTDDGAGFDPDAIAPGRSAGHGFGLGGMRTRVREAGGVLLLDTEPGQGTTVSAMVPLDAAGTAAPAEAGR
ncbi:sensor histidine kinase [Ornithinimicrobium sufpigmenti]|uniref:sensor histidine kinase n=1 Tax=Ornithinimicrobium sufpigmenti TaxID=2508882 RepID=UPI0010363CDB|nr:MULTISPECIES: ATP-binding protein [unclassified Ornithinimicrobium]